VEGEQGQEPLAAQIARLDPYAVTMQDLREQLIRLVENRLSGGKENGRNDD